MIFVIFPCTFFIEVFLLPDEIEDFVILPKKGHTSMIRLIVVLKQKEDIDCIMKAVDSRADLAVIGVGTTYYDAIKLADAEQPDIAVIDHQFEYGGLGIVAVLKRKSPGIAVILVSSYDNAGYIRDALSRGVSAYLQRKIDMDILINIVHIVHDQGCYVVSYRLVLRIFRSLPRLRRYGESYQELLTYKTLTRRISDSPFLNPSEMQIVKFLSQGKTTKEICETLHLKEGTVRNYISVLMRKTGSSSRMQMARSILNSRRQLKTGKPSPILIPSLKLCGAGKFLPLLEAGCNRER
jgi:DNA-binding NarL/FixJ family response regulator